MTSLRGGVHPGRCATIPSDAERHAPVAPDAERALDEEGGDDRDIVDATARVGSGPRFRDECPVALTVDLDPHAARAWCRCRTAVRRYAGRSG